MLTEKEELAMSRLHSALHTITSGYPGSPLGPCVPGRPRRAAQRSPGVHPKDNKQSLTIFLPFPPLRLSILPFNTDHKMVRLKSLPEGTT